MHLKEKLKKCVAHKDNYNKNEVTQRKYAKKMYFTRVLQRKI